MASRRDSEQTSQRLRSYRNRISSSKKSRKRQKLNSFANRPILMRREGCAKPSNKKKSISRKSSKIMKEKGSSDSSRQLRLRNKLVRTP